jgi:hypothetical protein
MKGEAVTSARPRSPPTRYRRGLCRVPCLLQQVVRAVLHGSVSYFVNESRGGWRYLEGLVLTNPDCTHWLDCLVRLACCSSR